MIKLKEETVKMAEEMVKGQFSEYYRPFRDKITPAFTLASTMGERIKVSDASSDKCFEEGHYFYEGESYFFYEGYLQPVPLGLNEGMDIELVRYQSVEELIQAKHILLMVQVEDGEDLFIGDTPDHLYGAEILTISDVFRTILPKNCPYIVIVREEDVDSVPPKAKELNDKKFYKYDCEVEVSSRQNVEILLPINSADRYSLNTMAECCLPEIDVDIMSVEVVNTNIHEMTAEEVVDKILVDIINRMKDSYNCTVPNSHIETLCSAGLFSKEDLESMADILVYHSQLKETLALSPESGVVNAFLLEEGFLTLEKKRKRIRFDGCN